MIEFKRWGSSSLNMPIQSYEMIDNESGEHTILRACCYDSTMIRGMLAMSIWNAVSGDNFDVGQIVTIRGKMYHKTPHPKFMYNAAGFVNAQTDLMQPDYNNIEVFNDVSKADLINGLLQNPEHHLLYIAFVQYVFGRDNCCNNLQLQYDSGITTIKPYDLDYTFGLKCINPTLHNDLSVNVFSKALKSIPFYKYVIANSSHHEKMKVIEKFETLDAMSILDSMPDVINTAWPTLHTREQIATYLKNIDVYRLLLPFKQ